MCYDIPRAALAPVFPAHKGKREKTRCNHPANHNARPSIARTNYSSHKTKHTLCVPDMRRGGSDAVTLVETISSFSDIPHAVHCSHSVQFLQSRVRSRRTEADSFHRNYFSSRSLGVVQMPGSCSGEAPFFEVKLA